MDLASGWEVDRYWRNRKRKYQENQIFVGKDRFKNVCLCAFVVCSRSHLSAYSVHVMLLNFKFAVALAIPLGAGGGTCGREGWCRQCAWVCSGSLSSENALWPPLVTKHRQGWDACLLSPGIQKSNTFPIKVRGESIYAAAPYMEPCQPT